MDDADTNLKTPYGRLGRHLSFRTSTLSLLAPQLHHQKYQGVR